MTSFTEPTTTELSCEVRQGERLLGFLVIHSLYLGSSRGGMRMAPDISEDEVRLLAEGMTLKFGLLGLPQGGAKAGVRGDPDAPEAERFEVLNAFGHAIGPLLRSRIYIPGSDIGTNNGMVRRMLRSQGVPVRHRELRGSRSGYFTALTAFSGARHAAHVTGLPLVGGTVAVEGFGNVGSSLAELFSTAAAKVVAVSTSHGCLHNPAGLDVADLIRAYRKQGSRFVLQYRNADRYSAQKLFEIPVDILCPCARHNSIQAENADKVRARIISPGSNHPYDLDTERYLYRRGVVCLPYWMTNCGGTLGETLEFAGYSDSEIADFMDRRLKHHVSWIITESAARRLTTTEVAKPLTLARFARLSEQASRMGLKGRAAALGLEWYRRGVVPAALIRPFSRAYFEQRVLLPFGPEERVISAAAG